MKKDMLAGQWKQIEGSIKQQWGKLTDDEIDRIEGSFDRLVGTIQERYAIEREEAMKQVNEYLAQIEPEAEKA
ncbi:MAG: CsbD family protein [Anaerolineales bacterium]|jgi:uncharacterized protein YjbJ (UPF0337 family)